MQRHRVAVTGLGIVAPNGLGKEAFWRAVKHGVSGVRDIASFDVSRYKCQMAGEVRESLGNNFSILDRASRFAIVAAQQAMADARITVGGHKKSKRMGVVFGTIHAGMLTAERIHRKFSSGRLAEINLRELFECSLAAPSWHVARQLDFSGPRSTVTMACASGTAAIGYAAELISNGRADLMLAGGVDTVNEFIFSGFHALGSLTTEMCRPFDQNRSGMVLGEGTAVLVLEKMEDAWKREANIYGEIVGFGISGDAFDLSVPDTAGGGLTRSILEALRQGQLRPTDVDYINAHGVGIRCSDSMECNAIDTVFGTTGHGIPMSSTKPLTGHAMGGAGAIDAVVCLLAIADGFLPATINHGITDPRYDFDFVPNRGRAADVKVVLSISSGLGGQNAALLFSKPTACKKKNSNTPEQRVVVTGVGIISPIAIGVEEYRRLLDGFGTESRVFKSSELQNLVAKLLIKEIPSISERNLRQMDNISRYAVLAAKLAMTDGCSGFSQMQSERAGVVLGTAFGSLESDMLYHEKLMQVNNPSHVNSLVFRNTTSNVAASQVSIAFGLKGVNATFTSGIVSGSNAVAYSYDLLRGRRANLILSGGIEKVPHVLPDILGVRNCENQAGVSDGAAILLLETLENAQKRGARAYCEIAGYGMADGHIHRRRETMQWAMMSALAEAGVSHDAIDYISPADCIDVPAQEGTTILNLVGPRPKSFNSQGVIPGVSLSGGGGFGLANCVWALQRGARIAVSNDIGLDGNCISITLKALR